MAWSSRVQDYVSLFDSGGLPLVALSAHLHGRPYRGDAGSPVKSIGMRALDALPRRARQWIYKQFASYDASPASVVRNVDSEAMADWAAQLYPARRYPAMMIGSSDGAGIHLCAALGIPWLPQTLLLQLRRQLHPDRVSEDLEWARGPASELLERNPDLRVYQMHDPNHDRLVVSRTAYFRLKRRRMGAAYEAFLREHLEPGGTIIVSDCQLKWPATKICDGHYFQFGGYGDVSPDDYREGSERISAFLERFDGNADSWDAPAPTGEYPESEWGFDTDLLADILRFAQANGFRVMRLVYGEPGDLSPFVADLYRDWYRQNGALTDRLLVPCFMFVQPHLTLTTESIPFWIPFSSSKSANRLVDYLKSRAAYDEILLSLFPPMLRIAGGASMKEWSGALARAQKNGRLLGVDEHKHLTGLRSFVDHTSELERLERRNDVPPPLSLAEFERRASTGGCRFRMELTQ